MLGFNSNPVIKQRKSRLLKKGGCISLVFKNRKGITRIVLYLNFKKNRSERDYDETSTIEKSN